MSVPWISDSSADPLLDEHFRRSLGEQKYRSLFNADESHHQRRASPPVGHQPGFAPPNAGAPSPTSSTPSASSSAKVSPKSAKEPTAAAAVDPVKAFHDDMESEGYTGTNDTQLFTFEFGGLIFGLWRDI